MFEVALRFLNDVLKLRLNKQTLFFSMLLNWSLRKWKFINKQPSPCYAYTSAAGHSVHTEFFKMTSESKSSNISGNQDEKIEILFGTLKSVTDRLAIVEEQSDNRDVCRKLDQIIKRVDSLESSKSGFSKPPTVHREASEHFSYSPNRATHDTRHTRPDYKQGDLYPPSSDEGFPDVSSVDLQAGFKILKDKYSGRELPAQFRLNTERTGVRRDDQPKLNIIASCAKYSETLLKIAATSDSQSLDDLKQEIYIAAAAQHKYLQSEYSAVLVDGSFDPQVSKFYRQLRKNTSAFDSDSLSDLKDAIAVCSQYKPPEQPTRGRGRGFSQGRGRFRGGFNRGYQSGDVYNRLAQIPNHRPQQQNDF